MSKARIKNEPKSNIAFVFNVIGDKKGLKIEKIRPLTIAIADSNSVWPKERVRRTPGGPVLTFGASLATAGGGLLSSSSGL